MNYLTMRKESPKQRPQLVYRGQKDEFSIAVIVYDNDSARVEWVDVESLEYSCSNESQYGKKDFETFDYACAFLAERFGVSVHFGPYCYNEEYKFIYKEHSFRGFAPIPIGSFRENGFLPVSGHEDAIKHLYEGKTFETIQSRHNLAVAIQEAMEGEQ